jgi:dTDP-4-amino-4,6-dideoxygalactose transaminase
VIQTTQPFAIRETFVPFSPPAVGEEEIQEVVEVLRSAWHTTGPRTRQFEQEFCEAFGSPAALALNSCTAGMHVALLTLGIGPGDEVITTPHTFCATCNVIEHVGARPVLVDVQDDTLNLDPSLIEAAITDRTKAIMPVHYAGHPVELDPIYEIGERRGLTIVEDAAHPVSGKYKGRFIGSGANPASFSFYATKNLSTAEGGMLTGSQEFIDRARVVALHGMSRNAWNRYDKGGAWRYDVVLPGFKYNLTDVQSAIGIHQLRKLPSMQAHRRRLVGIYLERLANVPGLRLPVEREEVESSWHLFVLRVDESVCGISRDDFIKELAARNVGTSVHYTPVHMMSFYRDKYGYQPEDFPVTYRNFEQIVSLPLSAGHSVDQIEYVCDAVLDVLQRAKG